MAEAKRSPNAPAAKAVVKPVASTKIRPSLERLEGLLDEAIEAYHEMEQLHAKLRRLKRGSERYLDLLPEIWVCGQVIAAKTQAVVEENDAIVDAMPDDD